MKVIKRDGRAVEYDKEKIEIAIEKANKEVRKSEKISKEEINKIINYIEELDRKRMLVEDIQDIIEQKLMEYKKYELAKKYIVYRYTRTLVRKQNTTDESILGLIKNQEMIKEDLEKDVTLVSNQRDYIAGEVSKDLTKRILLPEKITKAHEDGILHFHDSEYFLQPTLNSSLINLSDMLEKGTVINGKLIKSPKSFQVACTVTTQIILTVASNQYGGLSIDLRHLGKYLRKSKEKFQKEIEEICKGQVSKDLINNIVKNKIEKELASGIQTIRYQLNTLTTANGNSPLITLFLNLVQDEYIEENARIIEEMLKQREQGVENEEEVCKLEKTPKLIYVLYEYNSLKGGKYDYLTKLALNCSIKTLSPSYISAKKIHNDSNALCMAGDMSILPPWKDKEGNYKFEGRFNQGIVTINLPQIGILSNKDEDKFFKLLDERLELCYEALMCRHYALLGTKSDTSPIHWRYGAISRLGKGEKIDKLLKNGYSTLSLGYIGLYELVKILKGVSISQKQGEEIALKVIKHLKKTVDKWKKETGLGFTLYGTTQEQIAKRFMKIDAEQYENIKELTDKNSYTISHHIALEENINLYEKLKLEAKFEQISLGGSISYVNIEDEENLR